MRAALARLGAREHALVLVMHHIVSDGWSVGVLLRELSILYEAFRDGLEISSRSPLPELPVQYADYAAWQRATLSGEVLDREVAWWRDHLAGAPALLELPTDRPRPAVQGARGAVLRSGLSAGLTEALGQLARRHGATLFMTLLAAFDALLARYTGEEDLVVGSPIAGRTWRESEPLIGFFVNSLALRVDLGGDPAFAEILDRARHTALDAYEHQEVPFEKLVAELAPERSLAHAPIFQVMLVLQNMAGTETALADLATAPLPIDEGTAKLDLLVSLMERGGRLTAGWQYDTALFEAATVARVTETFERLLEGAVADPAAPLSALPVLSAAARAQMLREEPLPQPHLPVPPVHEDIAARAALAPQAAAVDFEGESLTYGELDRRANQLAHHLVRLGVGPDAVVGLAMERSLEMVVGVLAVLKAGGAYLPLDPAYPADRLAYMLEDSGARVLLTRSSELGPEELASEELPVRRVRLLADAAEIGRLPETAPAVAVAPENRVYLLYTSGSTGRPKGVEVTHGSLAVLMRYLRGALNPFGEGDAMVAVTTLSFDIAAADMLLPLTAGARIVLVSRGEALDGVRLAQRIAGSGATLMQATPATWHLLLESGWAGEPGLRIISTGEALPRELADRLLPRAAGLWNLYGPTETTIWASGCRVERTGSGRISIGRPVAGTRFEIVDRHFAPAPLGAVGELLIGGLSLARGYRGRPDLTAEKFVPDPFSARGGERLYRSGDLARYRPDGEFEVLGRIDHQVKVRGFRIELGEIESVLLSHPEVREAVVMANAEGAERTLVAWVTASERLASERLAPAALREHLRQRLPEFMVPALFALLPEMPRLPNGKVDRRALLEIGLETAAGAEEEAGPRTPVEELLAGLFAEMLGVERVGVRDSFFEPRRPLAQGDPGDLPRADGARRGAAPARPVRGAARRGAGAARRGGAAAPCRGAADSTAGGRAPRPAAAALLLSAAALVPGAARAGLRGLQPAARGAPRRESRRYGPRSRAGRDRPPPRGAAHHLRRASPASRCRWWRARRACRSCGSTSRNTP